MFRSKDATKHQEQLFVSVHCHENPLVDVNGRMRGPKKLVALCRALRRDNKERANVWSEASYECCENAFRHDRGRPATSLTIRVA
jgi:hypothetical protein